jgi:hypothetical protein
MTGLGNDKKFNPNTIFVSNLRFDLDESKLRSVFEKVKSY